jgi:hypothetical protein
MTARLRDQLPRWCALDARFSISDAQRAIQLRRFDVLVLDPAAYRFDTQMDFLKFAADAGSGVVLYAATDRESARRVVQVMRMFTCELVSIGAEHESELLERCCASPTRISAPSLVASELASNLVGLDPDPRAAFVALLGGMPIPSDVKAFIDRAASTERKLERQCVKRRLAPPSKFMVGAHILHSWVSLTSGDAISTIALQRGWRTDDQYRSQFKAIVHESPTRARARMHTAEFAHQSANSMRISDPSGPEI